MATAKKKTVKKKKKKEAVVATTMLADYDIVTATVPIEELTLFPGNARKGAIPDIRGSLQKFGQYRTVVVQKSTDFVLAGNNTVISMRENNEEPAGALDENGHPWRQFPTVDISIIDCPDDVALEIVVADNRLNDLATWDQIALGTLIEGLDKNDLQGTGYSASDMQIIDSAAQAAIRSQEIVNSSSAKALDLIAGRTEDEAPKRMKTETYFDEELDEEVTIETEVDDGLDGMETQPEVIGVLKIDPDAVFPGVGPLGIPVLRDDMLVEKLPKNLLTWGGSATKGVKNPDGHWLYNFGTDSLSGMEPDEMKNVVLSFYAYDEYFDPFFFNPEVYLAKTVNMGVTTAITPDFSCDTDYPVVESAYQTYKSMWVGRYLQELGIRVIPNLQWRAGDDSFLKKYVLPSIPKKAPWLAMGVMAFDSKNTNNVLDIYERSVRMIIKELEPEGWFCYGHKAGHDFVRERFHDLPCKIHYQGSRYTLLSNKAKGKKKKDTL